MKSFKSSIAAVLSTAVLGAAAFLASPAAFAAEPADAQANVGLWVVLDAKKGKEDEVANFLLGGRAVVATEPATSTWYAVRLTKSQFAIFDTFPDEAGRNAHLAGKVAAALMAQAPNLLQHAPSISKVEVLAVKLPAAK